jgi:hypothetical protein
MMMLIIIIIIIIIINQRVCSAYVFSGCFD